MDELLSITESDISIRDEIAVLLATAIFRKKQRAKNKEAARLDNSATSCMTVNTPEKTTEVAYE